MRVDQDFADMHLSLAGFRSIRELQDAIQQGRTTVRAITQEYIRTIEELNTSVNAITAINPQALEDADRLDNLDRSERGPLHGVPLIFKDQIETAGVQTAYGSKACEGYIPTQDATIVTRLKDAGAIVLAKSTMCDWAAGWFSPSSLSGTTKHPIDSTRDPGGSSAGNGTAVALGMAPAAIGGDTGGSVRIPSSFCGLVGVRVTPGRISRDGMSALVKTIDTPGPMCLNVEDAARLLDVMIGYDSEDQFTSINVMADRSPSRTRYLDATRRPFTEGKRLGVLRQAFGTHHGILQVLDETLKALDTAGVELVDVEIPDLESYKRNTALYALCSKSDINEFLASRSRLAHLKVEDMHKVGMYHKSLDLIESLVQGPADPTQSPLFGKAVIETGKFQRALAVLFAEHSLDAIIYPTCQVLAPKTQDVVDRRWDSPNFPTNTVIASQSLFTAISVPIGKAKDDDFPDDPALPVGLEILGLPLSEERILNVAAGIEALSQKQTYVQLRPVLSSIRALADP